MKSEEKKEIREAGKDPGTESTEVRGCSSVGRAPALQAGGHGFESHHLHRSCKQRFKLMMEPCESSNAS